MSHPTPSPTSMSGHPMTKANTLAQAHFQASVHASVNHICGILLVGKDDTLFWETFMEVAPGFRHFIGAICRTATMVFGYDESDPIHAKYLDCLQHDVLSMVNNDEHQGYYASMGKD